MPEKNPQAENLWTQSRGREIKVSLDDSDPEILRFTIECPVLDWLTLQRDAGKMLTKTLNDTKNNHES